MEHLRTANVPLYFVVNLYILPTFITGFCYGHNCFSVKSEKEGRCEASLFCWNKILPMIVLIRTLIKISHRENQVSKSKINLFHNSII